MYLHAGVQQVAELGNIPGTSQKVPLLLLREDVLPGPKEALEPPCTQGTSHQAFLTILHGTQEGTLPWAGKA